MFGLLILRRRHLSKPFYFNISYHNLKSIPSGINHLGHIYNTLYIFNELINHLIKKPQTLWHLLQDVIFTIYPGSANPLYVVTHYIKWGNYFLDTQY